MNEIYTPEQVRKLSSVEVARNVARVARLDLALEENGQTDGRHPSDFGSDFGQTIWYMDQVPDSVQNRRQSDDYDVAVMFSMVQRRVFSDITKVHPEHSPALDYKGQHTIDLQYHMAFDGYERAGELFEAGKDHVPTIGAFAAGALHRASIKSFVDRELYDRREQINAAREAIDAAVPARTLTHIYDVYKPRGKIEAIEMTGSVFSVDFNAGARNLTSGTEWWWNELYNDLQKIDHAAESL